MDQWIHDEILDGLSKLLCLGLDRTPASDLIAGTAMAWGEALTLGKVWDQQLDAPRFRRAFVALAATRKTWPSPSDFMDNLPPRQQLALTKQHIPANPEHAKRKIAEIARSLGRSMRA